MRDEHVPNLELGATGVAFRARGEVASWAMGQTTLSIARATRSLKVLVRPARDSARPGERLPIEVTVTDAQGRPVAARVSLVGVERRCSG